MKMWTEIVCVCVRENKKAGEDSCRAEECDA